MTDNQSFEKSGRKVQIVTQNKIHHKILQLMSYLNGTEEDDSEKTDFLPNQRSSTLMNLSKTNKKYYKDQLQSINTVALELEQEMKDLNRTKSKDFIMNDLIGSIQQKAQQAHYDLNKYEKKLNEQYRQYRDKFFYVKIQIQEKQSDFIHRAQNIQENSHQKLKKLVNSNELKSSKFENRNMLQSNTWEQIQVKIEMLKNKISKEEDKILENRQNQDFIDKNILRIQKYFDQQIHQEQAQLQNNFQSHYNTLQQIVHSVSSKIK